MSQKRSMWRTQQPWLAWTKIRMNAERKDNTKCKKLLAHFNRLTSFLAQLRDICTAEACKRVFFCSHEHVKFYKRGPCSLQRPCTNSHSHNHMWSCRKYAVVPLFSATPDHNHPCSTKNTLVLTWQRLKNTRGFDCRH